MDFRVLGCGDGIRLVAGDRADELMIRLCHDGSMVTEGRGNQPDCVFCGIVTAAAAGEPTEWPESVVYADDVVIAFLDRAPLFFGHTLVVPRRHVVTITDLRTDEVGPFFSRVQLLAAAMPIATEKPGVFVANNNIVSQSVAHLHVHVVPRQFKDGLRGFFWPRTRYGAGEGEAMASLLRGAISQILSEDHRLGP